MVFVKDALKNEIYCHDCKKEIRARGGEIQNGVLLTYDDDYDKISVFKCNDCFQNNPGLTNYKQCEVYSRIVGYLRPVQQWNEGKKQEYEKRKEFKEPKILAK